MDGTFVESFVANVREPRMVSINERDRLLVPEGWTDCTPVVPENAGLEVRGIQAVADYVNANVDGGTLPLFLHVENHTRVRVFGQLEEHPASFRRNTYVCADAPSRPFAFGQFYDSEQFIIWLHTQVVQNAVRDELIAFLSSITDSDVKVSVDDGQTQEVSTRRGITSVDRTKVPTPVVLAPFRTFMEVEQPTSPFVVRLRSGRDGNGRPQIALFEADGGQWAVTATERIKAWLVEHVHHVRLQGIIG